MGLADRSPHVVDCLVYSFIKLTNFTDICLFELLSLNKKTYLSFGVCKLLKAAIKCKCKAVLQ